MSRSLRWTDLVRRFPVTLGIAFVTVVMFVVQRVLGSSGQSVQGFLSDFFWNPSLDGWLVMLRLGALRADRVVEHGEYFRLLTSVFLHGGWLHLVLSMLAFLQLSALVEMLWGGRRVLVIYAVCGLAGSLCSAVLNDPAPTLAVGATGAVLGLAGVLMGTMWFGPSATAQWLSDLLGRRLLTAVLLTFGIGIALVVMVGPLLDNWAHFGGWLCGVLVAGTLPSPTEPEEPQFTVPAAGVASLALLGSLGWMTLDGDDALATAELDFARLHAERASRQPDGNHEGLVRMLQWYARADALDEGLETFSRQVERYDDPLSPQLLVGELQDDALAPRLYEPARIIAAERWYALSPDDPESLNTLAWFLVVPEARPALRNPERAERLSRKSLRELTPEQHLQEATYLDTLGEILYVKGDYAQAYDVQQRAVARLSEASESRSSLLGWILPLPTEAFEERLAKIEEARGQSDAG